MDIRSYSTSKQGITTLRHLANSAKPATGKSRSARLLTFTLLGLFCLIVVYVRQAGVAQWQHEEESLELIASGAQGRQNGAPGILGLKQRVGVPVSREDYEGWADGHEEALTRTYYIDKDDPRNANIRPLTEKPEGKCFADEIPGTEPFPYPKKAPLYAPVTWSATTDTCAEALNVDKVAIMLMAKGELHHALLWRQWFASAAGRLPVGLDNSCTRTDSVGSAHTKEACALFFETDKKMVDVLDNPLAHQILFNLYVHVLPGNEDDVDDLFRPYLVPRRVAVAWGKSSMIYAMRELIWFAFQDPRNTRFVLLSESDIPLYGPMPFYHELMAETKSRVDTSNRLSTDKYRWHYRFLCSSPPILEKDWRKSAQWFTLIREHAEIILRDTGVYRAFERFCHDFWDDAHDWYRVCYSDEHYIPTLLFLTGEGERTYPVRGPSHVDWSQGGPHPTEYSAQNVTSKLFRNKLRVTIDCVSGELSQATFINDVEEARFVGVFEKGGRLGKELEEKCEYLSTLADFRQARAQERAEQRGQLLVTAKAEKEASNTELAKEGEGSSKLTTPSMNVTSKLTWLDHAEAADKDDSRYACPLAARKFKRDTAAAVLDLVEKDCRLGPSKTGKLTGKLGIVDERVCNSWKDWQRKDFQRDFHGAAN